RRHPLFGHIPLAFNPARRRSRRDLALTGTASFAAELWLRRRFVRCRRFFTSLNRGAVTRDVSDQAIRVRVLDQRLVQSRWQSAGGEFGESPRKRCLTGHFAPALPAAQPT